MSECFSKETEACCFRSDNTSIIDVILHFHTIEVYWNELVKQIVRLLCTQKRHIQSCSFVISLTSSKWAFKPNSHSCHSAQTGMFHEPFNRTGCSGTNILGLYSGGACFQSRLGQWLSCLRFLWFPSAAPSKCWDSTVIRPQLLPSKSFSSHCSSTILTSSFI
jgi:hypothetical protein